nr:hypothetical protein CoNPh38_CDS0182 [Staphylococcus phage S-CoN_Ph38]
MYLNYIPVISICQQIFKKITCYIKSIKNND